jgi:hypothetical protein
MFSEGDKVTVVKRNNTESCSLCRECNNDCCCIGQNGTIVTIMGGDPDYPIEIAFENRRNWPGEIKRGCAFKSSELKEKEE